MQFFTEATRRWFLGNFEAPTQVQRRGWEVIASGCHALLIAPTGSGKTLAAFLWGIDRIARLAPGDDPGVRVLYVSPLRALAYDVERNLRAPLVGIRRAAEGLDECVREIRVDVRTGDTPSRERRQQARDPADILVTTPESLFLLLGSTARDTLRSVNTVIVDEVHALAPVKRGAHLALSLERLSEITACDPQRIGLSATVRPHDEVARFLGGYRPVEVVDAREAPHLDLQVTVPVPDMQNVLPPRQLTEPRGGAILGQLYAREVGTPQSERGIWPAIYPALLRHIRQNRSTIIFVNSRGLCERLSQRLNELAGEERARAHHGSVSPEKRRDIEEGLKSGRLSAIVATSSLELGVDMGAVDLVILVESPGSVARGLQRVGRAGHQVGGLSIGRLFPKFRGDLLECAVVASRMQRGEIEALTVPRNPLDVFAQQLVAMCCDKPRSVPELERLVRRAYPFQQVSASALSAVLDMLSGRYPSTEFADLRPLLAWDRTTDIVTARRGAAMVSRMNAGTIPDRGNYGVYLGEDGPRVGELDEEMVFETREGDHIILGATTWRVESITRDRVTVSAAPGEPGRMPFWRGDGPGRPLELGQAIGAFVRRLAAVPRDQAVQWVTQVAPVDPFAAENLVAYVQQQREHTGTVPTDRSVTIERFRDELGDWRVCILTPFGARIHAPWAMALQQVLGRRNNFEVQVMYTDDGIVLRFADSDELPDLDVLLPDPDELEGLVVEQLADTALFAGLFRENAGRSLLLPRRRPQRRNPLWAQRLKARHLLAEVRRYPSFPVVLETYRQAMTEVFDLSGLRDLLARIRRREIHVVDVETPSASPFARSLVFAYVAAYIYEQDAPIAERRAQALTLDRNLLGELLGQVELRELIDPEVLAELEVELQHLAPDRLAGSPDELQDVLRRLGDLTLQEVKARCAVDPDAWLAALERQRRAVRVTLAGEQRWIAADEAGLYRDALGVAPPAGLPDSFLAPVDQPVEQLLRRYARTHGPFLTRDASQRFALPRGHVEALLRLLEAERLLVRGELRPGGAELDWCDVEVLRRLKRRTLAKLRHEVAPVEARTLAMFLPQWHGFGQGLQGPDRLREVIAQLEGLPLPWSVLSGNILPERVKDFSLDHLDMLAASGFVVWIGCAPLGAADGRIALYRRDSVAKLLAAKNAEEVGGAVHASILQHLQVRGASFLIELQDAVSRAQPQATPEEFEAALWDLVWGGKITNDTFAPLRALRAPAGVGGRGRRRGLGLAGGRWSLVEPLRDASISETERCVARARMLLERYGVVSRESVQAEDILGGFAPVYRVLKAMEEAGRVRRGYFVEGLSGAQFGHPGAVERLRALRPVEEESDAGDTQVLAALDPANPYGALLPWPATNGSPQFRPRRVPAAWVILTQGLPLLYIGSGGRQVWTFATPTGDRDGMLANAFRALSRLKRAGARRLLVVEKVDGVPVEQSTHYALMRSCGFEADYRGVTPVASV